MKTKKLISALLALCLLLSMPVLGMNVAAAGQNQRLLTKSVNEVALYMNNPNAGDLISEECYPLDDGVGYTVASVSWEPNDTYFEVDCSYSVLVVVETKDGYTFSSDVTAAINDQPLRLFTMALRSLKYSIRFLSSCL